MDSASKSVGNHEGHRYDFGPGSEQLAPEIGGSGVSCCVIKSIRPECVTKVFAKDCDGNIEKTTVAEIQSAKAETRSVSTPQEFAALLESLAPNQCLTYGVPLRSPVHLTTERKWQQRGRPENMISRTKENFSWPSHGGVLMLDYDAPKDGSLPLTREQLEKYLFAGLGVDEAYVDYIALPSTSSCIYDGETEINGVRGQRVYVLVKEAEDIPRIGGVINDRLWALGHGRYEVSKSGTLLERPIFDATVWQTNRIDFAAGAVCEDGLEQRRGKPYVRNGFAGGGPLDTKALVSELSEAEKTQAQKNKAHAKAALEELAKSCRAEWESARVKEQLSSLGQEPTEAATAAARSVVRRAVEKRELEADWQVTIVDGGRRRQVSVAEILTDSLAYNGKRTLDPLEPDYDGGRPVGKIFLKGGKGYLHSMAHGEATYRLIGGGASRLWSIQILEGREAEATENLIGMMREWPEMFDFGVELVCVDPAGGLVSLNEHSLRHLVGMKVRFVQVELNSDGKRKDSEINPPLSMCRSILALKGMRRLKPLDAVISAPTLRPDGSVLDQFGYDRETRILYRGSELPPFVPQDPTAEQARSALEKLWAPFKDFPFIAPLDEAVHLAAILTVVLRAALPQAPAFGYDAPVQGSGKTLLACCVAVLGSGEDPAVYAHVAARDDEEIRKRLFAALRSGDPVLVWDNVVGVLDSVAMAALLTSSSYRDRILGVSEISSIPNRATLLLTGNNLMLKGDMARRVLVSRIDPRTDQPFAREFAINPAAHCLERRQDLVAAALTLVRFALTQDFRKGKGRMASFEAWDGLVRQTIICLSQTIAMGRFGDVMERVRENQARDPEQEMLLALMSAWIGCLGSKAVSA